MRRLAPLCLALLLAACDLLPKTGRKPIPPDTVDLSTLPAIRMDTMTDAAAAESSKAFAREEANNPSPMAVRIRGAEHYTADSGFAVSCIASESGGERLLQVEGLGRSARVNFSVYNGRDGKTPVGNFYRRRPGRALIANLQVSVGTHNYTDGSGTAQITDPLGRSGTITASNVVKMGAKKNESHRAHVSLRLRWHCE
jgi:hypothetical protein